MTRVRVAGGSVLGGLALSAVLALPACGGDDDAKVAATATTQAQSADATDAAATEPIIRISGYAFSGVKEVPVGTTVTIINDDTVAHTWSSYEGLFDSGKIQPGDSYEYTFDEVGSYPYGCNLHGGMNGSIKVTG